MKKFLSNFAYQSIFQLIKMLTPIITVPLVSHALGPKNIGLYNFTQSITQYFILFGGLGIALYGQRTIARVRDNKQELSTKFWELEGLVLICVSLMLILFFILLGFLDNQKLYIIQSLTIMAVMFDISWFFMGIEDFKITSLRSLLVTIITFIFIVAFVRNESDLYVYVAIQSGGIMLSQLIMWPFLAKKVNFVLPKFKNIFFHFTQMFQYFIPQIAIMLYTNLNKTLLGIMDTPSSVAYFSNGMIIVSIVSVLINTVDTVLLPNLSNLHAKNDREGIFSVLDKSLNLQLFFTIPATFGIALLSPKLVPWFFGKEFDPVKIIMPILAFLIIIKPIGASLSRQWLIPTGNLRDYNISVFVGAVVGVGINLLLIPKFGVYGAVTATVVSELFVTTTRVRNFVRDTGFQYKINDFVKYTFAAITMYGVGLILTYPMSPNPLATMAQIFIGVVMYLSITTILKANPLVDIYNERIRKKQKVVE